MRNSRNGFFYRKNFAVHKNYIAGSNPDSFIQRIEKEHFIDSDIEIPGDFVREQE
jgi:hypothetical protein